MASSFLDNLKNAVDKGEFNSEAAKKIIEVSELTEIKAKGKTLEELQESVDKRLDIVLEHGVKKVSEEEATVLNSDYEKKMEEIKKQDEENKRIADLTNMVDKQLTTLVEIEDMVKLSIEDMLAFTEELENKFTKEFEAEDPMFGELSQKIEQIKSKYNSIINN
jgi:hypothetical protein